MSAVRFLKKESSRKIYDAAKKTRKSAYGFIWEYC